MTWFNTLEASPAGTEQNEWSGSPGIAKGSNLASVDFCLILGNAYRFCKRPSVWGVGVVVERFDIRMFCILHISFVLEGFGTCARRWGGRLFQVSCVELSQRSRAQLRNQVVWASAPAWPLPSP